MDSKPVQPSSHNESETTSDRHCACAEEHVAACQNLPRFGEHDGHSYCVLHFPSKEKRKLFHELIDRKIHTGDFQFQGVWFPDKIKFTEDFKTPVSFAGAFFSDDTDFYDVKFSKADFSQTTFQGSVNFNDAKFKEGANFSSSRFLKNADFIKATFKKRADFSYSEFCGEANFETIFDDEVDFLYVFFRGEAYFRYAIFNSVVNFRSATFNNYVRFGGEELPPTASFDFQYARIEKPERVSFHTLSLKPHWFVNVNSRKFDFANVDWGWKILTVKSEVEKLQHNKVASPHRVLAITFRNLAFNAEENEQFEAASRFRYLASQLWRKNEEHDYLTSAIAWLYWAGSGYGERILRACVVLLGIWLIFAALYARGTAYTNVRFGGDESINKSSLASVENTECYPPASLPPMKAVVYSLQTMTLQKAGPQPVTLSAKTLVLTETIVGPIQAALLALAIRRKFMR